MLRATLTIALVVGLVSSAEARKSEEPIRATASSRNIGPTDGSLSPDPRFAIAAANTTVLASYTFDSGGGCDSQGWTVVDATAQIGSFWHVEDFADANVNPGDSLEVLAGSQSLWCGARAADAGLTCGYLALPGYGNSWDQVWQTKACIPVTGDLDVSFVIETDAEEGYDATYLEYTTDCTTPFTNWTMLDGGLGVWDGAHDAMTHSDSYAGVPASVKVRLRFNSDEGYSDQDGQYDSHAGPVVIDNLTVEGLALEDFEDETVGDAASDDWEADVVPGYGASYMALFPGGTQLQQDPCIKNVTCLWAAILGSTETYECGGFPQQAAVPKGNSEGQYLNADIWSPPIPLAGAGNVVNLEFAVYRDLLFDNLVFYDWSVRSVAATECGGLWRDRNFVFASPAGTQKDWHMDTFPVGDLLDFSQPSMQVRLGVVDMCKFFCGSSGSGDCHSHAPLLDNVRVYRVDTVGPAFVAREADQFQDTFPTDGSDTGTGRADAAISWQNSASMTNIPADSATIICRDPLTAYIGGDPVTGDRSGLAVDPVLGGWQIYCWVRVIDSGVPQVAGPKFGAGLQELPRYPFKDTQIADGKTWTRIRCDRANNNASRWRIDFPDALFTAGDVIEFFYGATNTSGLTSYCSGYSLNFVQNDPADAAAAASEFTILPLMPGVGGTDILYIDGMDGRGAQVYWDTALDQIYPADRYDVRAPASNLGNRPGARVTDVITQLNGDYHAIVWDCGNLSATLGDGTGNPLKSDDYALINTFLANLGGSVGGVYICGDDVATSLDAATGASASTFKLVYITYDLTSGDARPAYGIAPIGTGMPLGGSGQGVFAGDTWVIYGACPSLNDFDVMDPTGASVLQSTYGPTDGTNGAEIFQTTGSARVFLGGYSLTSIRDDDEDGVLDRARHLNSILRQFNSGTIGGPTDATSIALNRLEQNYPNPFNPTTTIAFSIKQRSRVKIAVYNVAGERVRTLLDETRVAGSYTDVRWDGTDAAGSPVASGVYFYKLAAADFSQTRKMVLLK
jgi:FlgD Ig-like domain